MMDTRRHFLSLGKKIPAMPYYEQIFYASYSTEPPTLATFVNVHARGVINIPGLGMEESCEGTPKPARRHTLNEISYTMKGEKRDFFHGTDTFRFLNTCSLRFSTSRTHSSYQRPVAIELDHDKSKKTQDKLLEAEHDEIDEVFSTFIAVARRSGGGGVSGLLSKPEEEPRDVYQRIDDWFGATVTKFGRSYFLLRFGMYNDMIGADAEVIRGGAKVMKERCAKLR